MLFRPTVFKFVDFIQKDKKPFGFFWFSIKRRIKSIKIQVYLFISSY